MNGSLSDIIIIAPPPTNKVVLSSMLETRWLLSAANTEDVSVDNWYDFIWHIYHWLGQVLLRSKIFTPTFTRIWILFMHPSKDSAKNNHHKFDYGRRYATSSSNIMLKLTWKPFEGRLSGIHA